MPAWPTEISSATERAVRPERAAFLGFRRKRIPLAEGMQLFTALQRQGVPSRLLYLPDEGHWVQKPRNARLWWQTVLDWIGEYIVD